MLPDLAAAAGGTFSPVQRRRVSAGTEAPPSVCSPTQSSAP